MIKRLGYASGAALLLAACSTATAHTNLDVLLNNGQVNPPVTPTLVGGGARLTSFGTATVVVDEDGFSGTDLDIAVFNIDVTGTQTADPNDDLIGARVHASNTLLPGQNAPIVYGFFGTPFNNTSPDETQIQPFIGSVGGFIFAHWDPTEGNGTTMLAQMDNLLEARAYLIIATTQFPNGEIRGTIPEPATGATLLGGAIFAMRCQRRRRV